MTEIVKYQNVLTKYQPTTLADVIKLADLFAASGLFNVDNARQSAAQLVVKILAGQELGFTPFAAANGMQIIKSKCAPGANLMAAMVKASGRYDYRVAEMTDARVSIDFFEHGKPIGTSTFTAQDAAKASTQNMGKFPRNMLFARAISNGVKWYCPDLANGVAMYTPEELGATVDYETGEIIEQANHVESPSQPIGEPAHAHTEQRNVTDGAQEDASCALVAMVDAALGGDGMAQDGPEMFDEPSDLAKKRLGMITSAQQGTLHALGGVGGKLKWDEKRPGLCKRFSDNRTDSSSQLTQAEANALIAALEGALRTKFDTLAMECLEAGIKIDEVDPDNLFGVELANSYKAAQKLRAGARVTA